MRFLLLALLATTQTFAASVIADGGGGYELNRNGALNRKYSVGTALANGGVVKAQYDFAVSGGTGTSNITLKDAEGLVVKLPNKAIIRNCFFEVVTTLTSGYNNGSSLSLNSAAVGDLKARTILGSLTGKTACVPDNTVGNMIKMASETTLTLTVGSEPLTAGKINVWVDYVISN